jgi:hypothetical protein
MLAATKSMQPFKECLQIERDRVVGYDKSI